MGNGRRTPPAGPATPCQTGTLREHCGPMDRHPAVQDAAAQPDLWRAAPRTPKVRPHYAGHRDRLRERALAGGLCALPDYEVLELQLFRSIPRGDVKPLAKQLLARFGSLGGVLGATPEELKTVKGVGDALALDLKLAHEMALQDRPRHGRQTPGDLLLVGPAGLCEDRPGARGARAVPGSVPRQEEPADRRRGDEPRHRRPCPGLSPRGHAPGAGTVGQRGDPGAQPSVRRSHAPPARTST